MFIVYFVRSCQCHPGIKSKYETRAVFHKGCENLCKSPKVRKVGSLSDVVFIFRHVHLFNQLARTSLQTWYFFMKWDRSIFHHLYGVWLYVPFHSNRTERRGHLGMFWFSLPTSGCSFTPGVLYLVWLNYHTWTPIYNKGHRL